MKKFMKRWYNKRKPLDLAIDCTGVVHRHKQTHHAIIKFYHVKPLSKGTEIVFANIGVRGGPHMKGKRTMTQTVKDFKGTEATWCDVKEVDENDAVAVAKRAAEIAKKIADVPDAKEVLSFYEILAKLHDLIKEEKGLKNESEEERNRKREAARASQKTGEAAMKAAAYMSQIKVYFWRIDMHFHSDM